MTAEPSFFVRLRRLWKKTTPVSPTSESFESSFQAITHLLSLKHDAIDEGAEARHSLAQTLIQVGLESLKNGLPGQAALALSNAADLGAEPDFFHYNLALAYSKSGQAEAAHQHFLRAQDSPVMSLSGDGYFIRNLYALDDVSLEDFKQAGVIWAQRHTATSKTFSHPSKDVSKRPLKIGLLSGRFCRHAVGFFTLAALEQLNSSQFELVLFSNAVHSDDYAQRFKAIAKANHDIAGLSDDDAAALIYNEHIDILIDLAGHSAAGRMGVMARKPAPVQAKWVGGQHGTTGVSTIDYFITDHVETPPDHDDYFVETPLRLPNSYGLYTPPPNAPDVNSLPGLSRAVVNFGCFNNISKISERSLDVWAHILNAVPNSCLVLKHLALEESLTRERLLALFLARGVGPDQLDMRLPTDHATHLRAYHDIDITLDPFPWSGCVTTCESLWMGVPVLTLPGVAFCHRHSASFLTTVGLTDWIASDVDDYVAKAVDFASRREELASLRQSLRDQVKDSPLCDAPRFSKDFETLLFRMWRERR